MPVKFEFDISDDQKASYRVDENELGDEDGENKKVIETSDGRLVKKRKRMLWVFEKSFANRVEAEMNLKAELWTKWKEHETLGGLKKYYKCGFCKKCPQRMYYYFMNGGRIHMIKNKCLLKNIILVFFFCQIWNQSYQDLL